MSEKIIFKVEKINTEKKDNRRYKENWNAEVNYCLVRDRFILIWECNSCAIKTCRWCV